MKSLNSKGQALIEAALNLPVLLGVISVMALTLYHGLIYYVADYQLHESLVCLHAHSRTRCQAEAEKNIQALLPKGGRVHLELRKNFDMHSGQVLVKSFKDIKIFKEIKL